MRPMQSSNSNDVANHPLSNCRSCGGVVSGWQPADIPQMAGHMVRYCSCCWSINEEVVEGVSLGVLEGMVARL